MPKTHGRPVPLNAWGTGEAFSSTPLGLGQLGSADVPVPESRVLVPSDMLAIVHWIYPEIIVPGYLGFGWPGMTWWDGKSLHQGGDLAVFCDGHVETSKSELIPRTRIGNLGVWRFKPDEARAKRWNNDNQPHPETWP